MFFEWDDGNTRHVALHGVTPDEAEEVVENNPLELAVVTRNGEERSSVIGRTGRGRILIVVLVERGSSLRVVTAYPAKRKWREVYVAQKATEDEKDGRNP